MWLWCTPLIPALRRQRLAELLVQGCPGIQSEYQEGKGYTEELCIEKPKNTDKITFLHYKELSGNYYEIILNFSASRVNYGGKNIKFTSPITK